MHARQLPSTAFRQTSHCIDDIAVELVFGSKQLEQRERASLANWLNNELLPALDELFSFYAPGEQIIRFEQLVFDFGHLPASDYRQIIREQLIQKLTHLIKTKSLPLQSEQRENLLVNRVTEAGTALTLLLDYLRTGQLTAQQLQTHSHTAAKKSSSLHQQLLESLLAEQHIAARLRALPNRSQLIARLVKQFSERHRAELLRQLAPQQVDMALALLDIWQTCATGASTSSVQTLWQFILQIALGQPDTPQQLWLQSLLQSWQQAEPAEASAFIQLVQQASWVKTSFAGSSAPASWLQLQTQLSELVHTNPHWRAGNSATASAAQFSETQQQLSAAQAVAVERGLLEQQTFSEQRALSEQQIVPEAQLLPEQKASTAPSFSTKQQQLAQALIRGDVAFLENNWLQWQAQHKQLLIAGLKHYLVNAELRQQLVLKLPLDLLNELLQLLAPDLTPLLQSFTRRTHNYLAVIEQLESARLADETRADRAAVSVVVSASEWLRKIYEIIARLIFSAPVDDSAEPIAIASREKFLSELVFHLAAQRDIPARELHQQWQQVLQGEVYNSSRELTGSDLTALAEQAQGLVAEHPASDMLVLDNLELNSEATDSVASDLLVTELSTPESLVSSSLLKKIHAVFAQVSAQELEALWPQVIAAGQIEIAAVVRTYWASASVRQELLPRLALPIIQQLLVLIVPAYQSWLEKIANVAAQLHSEALSLQTPPGKAQVTSAEAWLREAYAIISAILFSSSAAPATISAPNTSAPNNLVSSNLVSNTSVPNVAVPSIATGELLQQLISRYAQQYQLPVAALGFIWRSLLDSGAASASVDAAAQGLEKTSAPASAVELASGELLPAGLPAVEPLPVNTLANNSAMLESTAVKSQLADSLSANPVPVDLLLKQSAQELFDWCMQLKNNPQLRAQLPAHEALMARLIDSFVKQSPNFSPEFRQYFLFALDEQTSARIERAKFFRQVLLSLVDDELIDLDAIAAANRNTAASNSTAEAAAGTDTESQQNQVSNKNATRNQSPAAHQAQPFGQPESVKQADVHSQTQRPQQEKAIDSNQSTAEPLLAELPTSDADLDSEQQTRQRLAQLVRELRAGRIDPFGLRMSLYYWQRLLEQSLQMQTGDSTHHADLRETIRRNASDAIDPNYFYQQVIHALFADLPLDMEVFISRTAADQNLNQVNTIDKDERYLIAQENNSGSETITPLQETAAQSVNAVAPSNTSVSKDTLSVSAVAVETIPAVITNAQSADLISTAGEKRNLPNKQKLTDHAPDADNSPEQTILLGQPPIYQEKDNQEKGNQEKGNQEKIIPAKEQEIIFPEQSDSYSNLNANTEPSGNGDILRTPEFSLEQLLRESAALTTQQMQQLQQHVNLLLQHFTQAQAQEWLRVLRESVCAQRLIQQVPGHLLHQIVQRLQAAPFAALDPLVKLASEALALLVPNADPLLLKQARWEFVFARLFGPANPMDAAQLLQICCEQLASALGYSDSQRLLQLAERRLALLKPVAAARPSMSLSDGNTSEEPALNFEAGVHLNNVGMVLASPFLPRLFSMFNLLEDGKFIHPGAADRAAHLLQYMVTGQSETPEYELTLNKILCGISTSMPISAGIEVTEQEKQVIEQMLQSMIQHWKALGSTSVAGLRETFMQRQGWLILDEDYWRLKVQERTFDMLLDRLPWSISMIKHAWMDRPVRVSWREQS